MWERASEEVRSGINKIRKQDTLKTVYIMEV